MLSFKGGTLLLREVVTLLRSRDVIHKGPASFWCKINVPVSVIIYVLKKTALPFDSPLYNPPHSIRNWSQLDKGYSTYIDKHNWILFNCVINQINT